MWLVLRIFEVKTRLHDFCFFVNDGPETYLESTTVLDPAVGFSRFVPVL